MDEPKFKAVVVVSYCFEMEADSEDEIYKICKEITPRHLILSPKPDDKEVEIDHFIRRPDPNSAGYR